MGGQQSHPALGMASGATVIERLTRVVAIRSLSVLLNADLSIMSAALRCKL